MKILHITASYKPAFIYGGPIYSVAALCEALNENKEQRTKNKETGEVESQKSKVKNELDSDENLFVTENLQRSADYGQNTPAIQVYTTLANGDKELPYQSGETKLVDGVAVTYFKRITKDHSHCSPALLLHLWKNAKKFDIVHIHAWWNLVSMGATVVCLIKGIKPIISPRGMLGDYTLTKVKSIFHHFIGKQILKRCAFHATTSMEAEEISNQVFEGRVDLVDLMEEGNQNLKAESEKREEQIENISWDGKLFSSKEGRVGLRKIFVVHNIVKLPDVLPKKTKVFDGTLHLIFLSRIHPKKGIEYLLDALALVNFPFSLSIVGEGNDEYVENLKFKVKSLGLTKDIKWIGSVYGEKKYQLLAENDVFILPSYNENFANVVIEAIAVGTTVLLSDKVGLKDYVQANNYGFIFRLADLKDVLEKTYLLFNNKKIVISQKKISLANDLKVRYMKMYHYLTKC